MRDKKHTLPSLSLCASMALLSNPAMAHDGRHQMIWLQVMLHELAYTAYLPAVRVIAAIGVIATLRRRKAAGK